MATLATIGLNTVRFAPVVGRENQRAARCGRCRGVLVAGEGQAWRLEDGTGQVLSTPVYFCDSCAQELAAEQVALDACSQALEVIGKMLDFRRVLGFVDEERVRGAIRRAAQAVGAEETIRRAEMIRGRIAGGEGYTVWQVVELIEFGERD